MLLQMGGTKPTKGNVEYLIVKYVESKSDSVSGGHQNNFGLRVSRQLLPLSAYCTSMSNFLP